MRHKKIILIIISISLVALIIFLRKKQADDQLMECRYCTLVDYQINGTIDDISLSMDHPLDVKELTWHAFAEENGMRIEDHKLDECLALLFEHVSYDIVIEDPQIAAIRDNQLIPLKEGTTSADIKITIVMQEDLKCGPPPSFTDTINIKVT